MVCDVGAEDPALPRALAAARCVTPGLITSLTGNCQGVRVCVLGVGGVVGDKLVVHHYRPPRPVEPGGQGTAQMRVLAACSAAARLASPAGSSRAAASSGGP